MSDRLQKKVAVITGGASGIGEGIVRRFCAEGAQVILADVDEANGSRVAAECGAHFALLDVSSPEGWRSLAHTVRDDHRQLDILVNNAGHNITENFEDISEGSFERMLDVHVKGTFFFTQAVYKDMKARGSGRIINITSQLAYKGAPTLTHYCAAKGANATFTRALALESAGTGVLVNAVAPGVTNTDLLTPLADELLADGKLRDRQ